VDPLLLRSAFRIGFLILVMALLVLPFEDRSSPEFVVTVLTVVVGAVFVAIVTLLARSTLPPPPRKVERNSVDKATGKEYNQADSHPGGDK
jgi:predicted MFS family arabinose efflux permease